MVNLMRSEYVKRLSPEGRVKNELESLYFGVKSGDVETEELFRYKVQQAFAEHDVCLNDKPSEDTLRTVMLDTCKEMTKELQGEELSPEQIQTIERNFDSLKGNYDKFYETIFDSYEKRYDHYESVDLLATDKRMKQLDVDPFQPLEEHETIFEWQEKRRKGEPTMSELLGETTNNQGKQTRSGLSYADHVPEAKTHVAKRSYKQVREEEKVAEELKGTDYDKKYDQYARNRGDSYSKFTAGDDYGFDEHDDELEDDGPEL